MLFRDGRAERRFFRLGAGLAPASPRGGVLHVRFGFAEPASGGGRGFLSRRAVGGGVGRPPVGLDRADGRADLAAARRVRDVGQKVRGHSRAAYAGRGMADGSVGERGFAGTGPPRLRAGAYQCPAFRTAVPVYGAGFAGRAAHRASGHVGRGAYAGLVPEGDVAPLPPDFGGVGTDVRGGGIGRGRQPAVRTGGLADGVAG